MQKKKAQFREGTSLRLFLSAWPRTSSLIQHPNWLLAVNNSEGNRVFFDRGNSGLAGWRAIRNLLNIDNQVFVGAIGRWYTGPLEDRGLDFRGVDTKRAKCNHGAIRIDSQWSNPKLPRPLGRNLSEWSYQFGESAFRRVFIPSETIGIEAKRGILRVYLGGEN